MTGSLQSEVHWEEGMFLRAQHFQAFGRQVIVRAAPAGQWQTLTIPLRCFASAGVAMNRVAVPFRLTTAGKLSLAISDIRVASAAVPQDQCGQP